jgi:Protein of unknown function (DUF1553)/Protein of unknown function (DUF1549)/Planctomycete cytochrome C
MLQHFQLFPVLLCLFCSASMPFAFADEKIDFNRDVRPILSDKCLTCHGTDPKHVEAGLRLDLSESAFTKLESTKHAIVPGRPDDSELIRRIRLPASDELRMPPVRSHKNLSFAELEILERWIAQGAEYKKHWAFVTPERPSLPPASKQWGGNDIDAFVLAKFNSQGLSPSPEATRETLIRRASLDLTGLPPTVAEVEAFVKDNSPTSIAYEKVIDRLLTSPRYAERMTMWWLDGARYADSNGFQSDDQRFMHGWRDWVLNAFDKNMPFDQFTIEQLAGDLLPDATLEQKIATGFNRNNRQNSEGGLIAEEWRIEGVIDRVEATSAVWMALTMGCARCHDHKYDPISQKEMYQFFSYFNNVPESGVASAGNTAPLLQTPSPADVIKLKELDTAIASAQQSVQDAEGMLIPAAAQWAVNIGPKLQQSTNRWRVLEGELSSDGGSKLKTQADGTIQVSGKTPALDVYSLSHKATLPKKVSAFQLEAIPHASLAASGFGRKGNGNIVLGEVEAEVTTESAPNIVVPIKIVRAFADYSQANWNISAAIDGNPATGWALDGLDPSKQVTRHAVFVFSEPVALDTGSRLTIRLKQESLSNHNLGLFRLSATDETEISEAIFSPLPESLVTAILVPANNRSEEQKKTIVDYYRTLSESPVAKATTTREAAKKAKADFERNIPTVMVMQETPQPRDCFVLVRGQYDKPGEKVTASLPSALPPLPNGAPNNRLGVAKWLVDPSHPLTSRVQVNRYWELLFGTGIVKSSENFGMQSQFPSHPELLDWLATEYIRLGWDTKALLKTILMSATYRQSSNVTPELMTRDPENRLLARGPRFRLQAELVRDNALAISGLLVEKVGGPPVRPYQPEGIWDEINVYGNLRNYKHDKDAGLYRRSMYTIWKRTSAPPNMLIFDMPGREMCVVRRSRTNTPLQALSLLNEVTYVEASRALAERMLNEGGSSSQDRIRFAFQLATARMPTERELNTLAVGLERRKKSFEADPESAKKLLSVGEKKSSGDLSPLELAAYTITASVILNLDETVTKE